MFYYGPDLQTLRRENRPEEPRCAAFSICLGAVGVFFFVGGVGLISVYKDDTLQTSER